MHVYFLISYSQIDSFPILLQVVADAALNIASSLDRRASAYIDSLWALKEQENKKVIPWHVSTGRTA